ncbi:MAG TPA: hypothetical protein VGF89_11355 [Steroidobacteraceae bacterium]
MGGRALLLMQSLGHHLLGQLSPNSAWRAGTWFIEQSFKPSALNETAPLRPKLSPTKSSIVRHQHDCSDENELVELSALRYKEKEAFLEASLKFVLNASPTGKFAARRVAIELLAGCAQSRCGRS